MTSFLLNYIEWIFLTLVILMFSAFTRVLRGSGQKKNIMRACHMGNLKEVGNLLADAPWLAKMRDGNGFTPLHVAALWDQVKIVKLLLRYEADVNARNETQMTPLHAAAMAGHIQVVQSLLMNGAEVNATNLQGNTPLYMAVWDGRADVVDLLLRQGADPTIATAKGDTPLDRARVNGHQTVAHLLNLALDARQPASDNVIADS